VGVPGGKRGNVETGGGGARVSTISQPGCSTSVALATGPTEEEEEEEEEEEGTLYLHTFIHTCPRFSYLMFVDKLTVT